MQFCRTKKKIKRFNASKSPWDPKDLFFSDAEDYQLKISFHSPVMASVGVDVIFIFPLLASLQQTLVHATCRSLH
jgi:hypothetical protein